MCIINTPGGKNMLANKYILYAIIITITLAILSTYVLMWKSNIRKQAALEFNNKQLEQTIKDQEQYILNMKAVNEKQRSIIEETNKKNEQLAEQLASIEDYLNSEEVKLNDRPASNIIRETIRKLSGQPK
jgi:Tfp pilus assembly protein PilO